MIALLCAALSGAMFYASLGLDNVWWLAWLAPAPLLWLAYGKAPAWQVFLASLVAFGAGQIYLIQCYGAILGLKGLGPLMALVVVPFPFAILFARLAARRLPPIAALVAFPALWTAVEYLVSFVSPHGSYGSLAYSQMSFPMAVQAASFFGLYAVSFLLCLGANSVALLARGGEGSRLAVVGLSVVALNFGFGYMRLQRPPGASVRVAALANEDAAYVKAATKGDFRSAREVAQGYAAAAKKLAAEGATEFVTPEGSVIAQPAWRDAVFRPLEDAASATGSTIIAGTIVLSPPQDLAVAFTPDGRVQSYAKRHLLLPSEAKFTPGHSPGLIGDGRAMAICKDMDFPRTIRNDATHGIRLMAVPAGDFGGDGWIHARMAIMRGVENGFAVLRSAFNGLETISDAQGRVLARSSVMHPAMISIVADVPLGPGPTLYTRIGDVFAWACLLVVTVLGMAMIWRRPCP